MDKALFNTLPYISRKELIDLRNFMDISFEKNSHLIYDDKVDSVLYQFKDFADEFVYNVSFGQFDSQKNINIYIVYYNPRSLSSIEGSSHHLTLEQLKTAFTNWIEIIIQMHEVTQKYYDPFSNFYNEQFEYFFTNEDEDANVNPFEVQRQEIIYYFLTYAQKVISASSDITENNKEELTKDIDKLKNNIPILTKKKLVSAISKLAQKSKKLSNKLFHDIFDVLKKEVIKKILYKGLDEIPDITSKIENWINLLN